MSLWDDEVVRLAAFDLANGIRALRIVERAHGHDAYLMGQARERVGELHIAYLQVTGELPRPVRERS